MNKLQLNIVRNYLALRRLEESLSRLAEAYCNGKPYYWHPFFHKRVELSDTLLDQVEREAIRRVQKFLGEDIHPFINWDPRGYQIKLPHNESDGIHQDWGGYGCPGAEMDIEAVKALDAIQMIQANIVINDVQREANREHIETLYGFIRERTRRG